MNDTGFLRHITFCTRHDPSLFSRFFVCGKPLGWVKNDITKVLMSASDDFVPCEGGIALSDRFKTYETRNAALSRATNLLCAHFGAKTRNEMYPIIAEWGDEPLAELDRIAVPWFGTRGFGVHVNGYVETSEGIFIWIAKRAEDRLLDPGKLDHIVAGGSPIGLTIRENLAKECHEEANIPERLCAKADAIGALTYQIDRLGGLRNDTLFVFDLKLDLDFKPENTDGEVAGFNLLPAEEVAKIVETTDNFKFNCNLVIIDFLLRHGVIKENHPEYAALQEALAPLRLPYPDKP